MEREIVEIPMSEIAASLGSHVSTRDIAKARRQLLRGTADPIFVMKTTTRGFVPFDRALPTVAAAARLKLKTIRAYIYTPVETAT